MVLRLHQPFPARPVMLTPIIIVALACLVASGCILYTQPVNSAPTVKIVAPTQVIVRGQEIEIAANVTDPDGDPVTLGWSTSSSDKCAPPLDATMRPPATFISPPGAPEFPLTLAPNDATSVCVWVIATDSHGATAVDAIVVSSENRPPVAVIEVLEPTTKTSGGLYELYSVFHLSAAMSHDPDGDMIQNPTFELTGFPPAATPTLVACRTPTPTDLVTCLDVGGWPGTYAVKLTVDDGHMGTDATTTMLVVDYDHPPCVKTTVPGQDASPIVAGPDEARTFEVQQILDDGAPLPTPADGAPARPTFAWKVRRNAGAWQTIVGYDNINALTLPAGMYATGDVVDVNVTISDGVAMHLQPACDPMCPVGCPQSASWTVDYR
jgi:hypothetical protein